jgi:hypothetical protein
MARKSAPPAKKEFIKASVNDAAGRSVCNTILQGLPDHECTAIFSRLDFVSLPTPTVLNEADEAIKFAFFVNDGLASVLAVMEDGKSVEVGLCGKEGFVGLPLTWGLVTSPTRVIMQVSGSGFRISAKNLAVSLKECRALVKALKFFQVSKI